MADGVTNEINTSDEMWHSILTQAGSPLHRSRRLMKLMPASDRCKVCNTPLSGAGGVMLRFAGIGRAKMNPRFCSRCENMAEKHPGGAVIELTMLFADVRGSTTLAESQGNLAFTRLIGRFYDTATRILISSDAFVDRLIGDEAIGLFLPLLAGSSHAARAVEAARRLLSETGHGRSDEPWIPVGVGIHTGHAFVGSVGTSGVTDFTALGDDVNATARLASTARSGEILVSEAAARAAGLELTSLDARQLELKGRQQPMDVYVVTLDRAAAAV